VVFYPAYQWWLLQYDLLRDKCLPTFEFLSSYSSLPLPRATLSPRSPLTQVVMYLREYAQRVMNTPFLPEVDIQQSGAMVHFFETYKHNPHCVRSACERGNFRDVYYLAN
jgi:hypothetical protein